MGTATGQEVQRGDRLVQVAPIGLGALALPMVVQRIDHERHGVVLGDSLEAPPRTSMDGSVRIYPPGRFLKV